MEEVTKCRYIDCVDTREKEQILHELPVCDIGLCVRWLINSGHVDLIGSDLDALRSMKFFICNNHFTEDCYLSKGTLKENAVPSPHWSAVSRTLRNLKIRRKIQLNGQETSMEEAAAATNQVTEKNAPSEFEVDQWCRTCATRKQNLVSMTTKGKGSDMSLLSKLKLLIEIDDEDALPTKMCEECVDKLEQSFKFFQQIYVADNTLRHVFPNARSSSAPRKPLYSIGEHMRNEQNEKGKEKERKEKEEGRQQQPQDRTPKVTRGIFRRGRGRPRSRGYAARARARQRSAQISIRAASPNLDNDVTCEGGKANEPTTLGRRESRNVDNKDEERQGDTVFSLLIDTCHSDEELDWSDVLKVMNDQRYRVTARQGTTAAIRSDKSPEKKTETQVDKSDPIVAVAEVEKKLKQEAKAEEEVEVKPEIEAQGNATESEAENAVQRIRCEFCNESFQLEHHLQTHLSIDHSQSSGYTCIDCLASYESESLLSKHRSLGHGGRTYHCEYCREEFPEKRVLREHVKKCEPQHAIHCAHDSCESTCASKLEHTKTHPEEDALVSFHADSGSFVKPEEKSDSSPMVKLEPEQQQEPVELSQRSCSPSVAPSSVVISQSKSDEKSSNAVRLSDMPEDDGAEEPEKTKEESVATCPDCNEQMQDTVELSIHRMRRHSMNRKDTTCLLCDNKSFSSLEEYERHVLDHCKRLRISP